MFGRKMNNFEDWKSKNLDTEVTELIQRSNEIAKLRDETQQTALMRIKDAQEVQKDIQNKRTSPQDETLPNGTTVFVKKEGLLGSSTLVFQDHLLL